MLAMSSFAVASSLRLDEIGAQRRHYNPNSDPTDVLTVWKSWPDVNTAKAEG
jgi:predicted oxidoreductase (fatty acid repression mutant protein)